jgi:hypothetical protein
VLDTLQQRDAEGQGLAGARAGLADDVVPAEADRNGERLDRERFDDALGFEGICYFGDNPELTKGRQGLQPPVCGVRSTPRTHRDGGAASRLAVATHAPSPAGL